MILKVVFFILLTFSTNLFAHKVPGMDISLEKIQQDKILIKAFFKKSKRALVGNKVKLISKFDNRVLSEGKLEAKGLVLDIPSESYWVYVIVRDNDLVKDGIPPNNGFNKKLEIKKLAFLYTLLASIFFIFISFFIAYKRNKLFKRSLS